MYIQRLIVIKKNPVLQLMPSTSTRDACLTSSGLDTTPSETIHVPSPIGHSARHRRLRRSHAETGYKEALISALKETQYDQPMEEEEAIIPSPSPVELTQPFALGPDNKTSALKTSSPIDSSEPMQNLHSRFYSEINLNFRIIIIIII